jgi:sugar/nucleoside kinase (ribokinase family)
MQSMQNRIAVIGTINKDTIHTYDGKIYESYGGLLYTIIPLAQMLGKKHEILPILNLGKDCRKGIMPLILKYPNIDQECISVVPQKNNHCHLFYSDRESNMEILRGGVPALTFTDIEPALSCRITIVNFISGRDVSLRSLEKFRKNYQGRIYMDIHSLTLGKRKSGKRYFRKPANWKRYCSYADYLQMNKEEFELLSGKAISANSMRTLFKGFGKGILKVLHVTMGAHGSFLVYRPKLKIIVKLIKLPEISRLRDTTGCGDVFGAAFVAAIMKGYSIYSASRMANKAAAQNCRFAGIEDLRLRPL